MLFLFADFYYTVHRRLAGHRRNCRLGFGGVRHSKTEGMYAIFAHCDVLIVSLLTSLLVLHCAAGVCAPISFVLRVLLSI